jgi:hypothetical protein
MKSNLNGLDRVVRALLFVLFAVLYFTGTIGGTLGLSLFIAGAVLLLTSFINFCPIYYMLGWSTNKRSAAI